jgi:hypothetical protein
MNFYQNLINAKLSNSRITLTIVAAWQFNYGVRVMGVTKGGETFLVDLPDVEWTLSIKNHCFNEK